MNRNEFLKLVAATIATITTHTTPPILPRRDRIKVGQIGTKHAHAIGQLTTLRQLDSIFEVVGVVEPDQNRRRELERTDPFKGIPWMTEEQLLNTRGLKAVAVETEIEQLLPTAQKCIDASLHIHLDKPAGSSLPALKKLHRSASQKNLSIQMGYMFRYNPAFRFLFEWTRSGLLGEIFEVHGVMSKTIDVPSRLELAKFSGGSMFELGCHLVDPLLHIMGPPTRAQGILRQTHPEKDELADNTLAIFEFPKASATIRSSVIEIQGARRRQFSVCGTRGTIVILPLEAPTLKLTLGADRENFKSGTHGVALPKSPGRYHGAWIELAKLIRGEKQTEFSHEHDLAVQQSLLQACGMPLGNGDSAR